MFDIIDKLFDVIQFIDTSNKVHKLKYIMGELVKNYRILTLFKIHPSITIEVRTNEDNDYYPVLIDNHTCSTMYGGLFECYPNGIIELIYSLLTEYSRILKKS